MSKDYIAALNKEYGTQLTGVSPLSGNKAILKKANRVIVKEFANGLGRVFYIDNQNRLIATHMETVL